MTSLFAHVNPEEFDPAEPSLTEPNSTEPNPTEPSPTEPDITEPDAALEAATDDLQLLLEILPEPIRQCLVDHPRQHELIEIILDLGRRPEARFPGGAEYLSDAVVTKDDLLQCVRQVGHFGGDNRGGIERTLHRISAIRNRSGDIVGLTCRVGRAVFGTVGMIRDLVETGQSILMLGRPGVGKTTALREIARVLADDLLKRVVIIDTSNEIAGDGDIPHPAIGRARRMQVAHPDQQHQVMIEAVENHTPEVIVIDEIGTELEALAARTIAERGVQLIGTAHGNQLENLLKNPTLSDLVGGIQTVTLGDDEARRRRTQKSVLERKAPPTFEVAIEMAERARWVVHENVAETVDNLLRGRQPIAQVRTTTAAGEVQITETQPELPPMLTSKKRQGWRASGQMAPLAPLPPPKSAQRSLRAVPASGAVTPQQQQFESLLEDTLSEAISPSELLAQSDAIEPVFGPHGEELTLVYPYGISRDPLDHVIHTLGLPLRMTKDLDQAQAVLALRSHLKNHTKLKQMARSRQLPIYTVKSNSIPQITRALRRLLDMDDGAQPDNIKLELFSRSSDDDELEALEEARLAVEQIVIPKGQPVELLPRSGKIRKMQHELAEHYRLKSLSFGDEPNRRLRIYPA